MDLVVLNGEFVPRDKASIPITDRSFRFGDGIYEVLAVYDGVPYQMERHEERLKESLDILKIELDTKPIMRQVKELIAKNKRETCAVRITLSRGLSEQNTPEEGLVPTVLIETLDLYNSNIKPIKLYLSSWKKIPLSALPINAKTNQALQAVMVKMEVAEHGCDEAVLVGIDGQICECASATIFWVKDNVLYTPSMECGILPGTTRKRVIELSHVPVKEGIYKLDDLKDADEVFITSVTRTIVPVISLDPVGCKWDIGPVTKELKEILKEDIASYVAQHAAVA